MDVPAQVSSAVGRADTLTLRSTMARRRLYLQATHWGADAVSTSYVSIALGIIMALHRRAAGLP